LKFIRHGYCFVFCVETRHALSLRFPTNLYKLNIHDEAFGATFICTPSNIDSRSLYFTDCDFLTGNKVEIQNKND
jgi:hypothetical protein